MLGAQTEEGREEGGGQTPVSCPALQPGQASPCLPLLSWPVAVGRVLAVWLCLWTQRRPGAAPSASLSRCPRAGQGAGTSRFPTWEFEVSPFPVAQVARCCRGGH